MLESVRGWQIIFVGVIWLLASIMAFWSFMPTWILGVIYLLLAITSFALGFWKIAKFERYEQKPPV